MFRTIVSFLLKGNSLVTIHMKEKTLNKYVVYRCIQDFLFEYFSSRRQKSGGVHLHICTELFVVSCGVHTDSFSVKCFYANLLKVWFWSIWSQVAGFLRLHVCMICYFFKIRLFISLACLGHKKNRVLSQILISLWWSGSTFARWEVFLKHSSQ